MRPLVFLASAGAAVLAACAASAAGGPSPGVLVGGSGVVSPNGAVRYVAYPRSRSTTVRAIGAHGGQVFRSVELRGRFGVPAVAYDGTTGGVSADGRTLVLTSVATRPVT